MNEYFIHASDGSSQIWFYVTASSLANALTLAEAKVSNGLAVVDDQIPPVTVRVLAQTLISGTVTVQQQPLG